MPRRNENTAARHVPTCVWACPCGEHIVWRKTTKSERRAKDEIRRHRDQCRLVKR